jgi:hypothetical protein
MMLLYAISFPAAVRGERVAMVGARKGSILAISMFSQSAMASIKLLLQKAVGIRCASFG